MKKMNVNGKLRFTLIIIVRNDLFTFPLQVATSKFISITYMMMEVMSPVTQIAQFFQKENIDVAVVKVSFLKC